MQTIVENYKKRKEMKETLVSNQEEREQRRCERNSEARKEFEVFRSRSETLKLYPNVKHLTEY